MVDGATPVGTGVNNASVGSTGGVVSGSNNGNVDQVLLATGGYDYTIKLWQAHSGICQKTLQHADSQVNAIVITPDRKGLAAAAHQHVRTYDLTTVNPTAVLKYGVTKNITGLGFQEDGKWMFTGGEDCCVRIWDLRSRNLQCQRIFQVSAPVNCVCLHPNQAELIVGDQSGVIHLWDLRTDHNEQLVMRTDHNEQLIPEAEASIQAVSIDPDGTFMAAVNNKGHCYIWALTGGIDDEPTKLNPKHKIEAHQRYALNCKFSPDSVYLATTSADQSVRIWKTADFTLVQELKHENQRWVWDVAFSADSQYVITASSDGAARLWNIASATVEREYSGHQKAVTALAFCDQLSTTDVTSSP